MNLTSLLCLAFVVFYILKLFVANFQPDVFHLFRLIIV
jgi:hypothetical protein